MNLKISRKNIGLVLGPILFLLILLTDIEGLSWNAKVIAASTAWIACWWLTEAIPIPITSLLPIILFPLLGAVEVGKVTAEYGNQIIFLLIGGFLIAIAMEKWRLHVRIALLIVKTIGTSPRKTIAGFMAATAFISAWISNTATAMMMIPIAIAVISQDGIKEEIVKLGKITSQEKKVLAVFLLVAALWITRVLWGKYLPMVMDSVIAIFGAFLLFLIPAEKGRSLLNWNDALKLPWDVVLLLGGGLAIAKGFTETGLEVWIAQKLLFLKDMPAVVIMLAVVTLTIFLTEITSNTATATIILPVATPPNAIVFGTGFVTIPQMARAGLLMNIICIAIITLFITFMLH